MSRSRTIWVAILGCIGACGPAPIDVGPATLGPTPTVLRAATPLPLRSRNEVLIALAPGSWAGTLDDSGRVHTSAGARVRLRGAALTPAGTRVALELPAVARGRDEVALSLRLRYVGSDSVFTAIELIASEPLRAQRIWYSAVRPLGP
jgi:hypothetical protein